MLTPQCLIARPQRQQLRPIGIGDQEAQRQELLIGKLLKFGIIRRLFDRSRKVGMVGARSHRVSPICANGRSVP